MKKATIAMLLGAVALTVGCHRNHDDGSVGVSSQLHGSAGAQSFTGTINGEAAELLLYRSGNHTYGNINLGVKSARFSGYIDPHVMTVFVESGLSFTNIKLQLSGGIWTVIEGGSGALVLQ